MQHRFLRSLSRFFESAGRALVTPSGDDHDRTRLPVGTMHDADSGTRIMGH